MTYAAAKAQFSDVAEVVIGEESNQNFINVNQEVVLKLVDTALAGGPQSMDMEIELEVGPDTPRLHLQLGCAEAEVAEHQESLDALYFRKNVGLLTESAYKEGVSAVGSVAFCRVAGLRFGKRKPASHFPRTTGANKGRERMARLRVVTQEVFMNCPKCGACNYRIVSIDEDRTVLGCEMEGCGFSGPVQAFNFGIDATESEQDKEARGKWYENCIQLSLEDAGRTVLPQPQISGKTPDMKVDDNFIIGWRPGLCAGNARKRRCLASPPPVIAGAVLQHRPGFE